MKGFDTYLRERYNEPPASTDDVSYLDTLKEIIKDLEINGVIKPNKELNEGSSISNIANAASMALVLQLNKLDRETKQTNIFQNVQSQKTTDGKIETFAKYLDSKINSLARLTKYAGLGGVIAAGLSSSNRKILTKVKSIKGR